MSSKITPLYFLSSKNTYFAQKEPIKVKIYETFKCSGQNVSTFLCQFRNNQSIPLQILYPSPVSLKITPLHFFSSNNIYFVQKEHIKMRLSNARVKTHQIPHVNFELTSQSLFKIRIILHCRDT